MSYKWPFERAILKWKQDNSNFNRTGNVQAAQNCWHIPAVAKYCKGSCTKCPWWICRWEFWSLAAVVGHIHGREAAALSQGFGPTNSHNLKRNSSSLWPQLLLCTEQCQSYSASFPSSFHSRALKTLKLAVHAAAEEKCATLRAKGFPLPGSLFFFSVLKILSLKKRTWSGAPDCFLLE